MPTEAKRETVAGLQALAGSRTLIASEYRGLTVKEIAEIRRALRKQDVSVPRRQEPADADRRPGHDRRGARPLLTGPTAIAFGNDESAAAKAVIDATRPTKVVDDPGAVSATGRSTPTRSRAWPACRHARSSSELAGGMQAPIATLAGLLHGEHPEPRLRARPGPRPEDPGRRLLTAPHRPR